METRKLEDTADQVSADSLTITTGWQVPEEGDIKAATTATLNAPNDLIMSRMLRHKPTDQPVLIFIASNGRRRRRDRLKSFRHDAGHTNTTSFELSAMRSPNGLRSDRARESSFSMENYSDE
ncbi:hypothetical protein Q1695_004967 [Nippostrongylus brasiliensis]|nr:hypothetical protein Q1695_004967 [Nippostrongylus brasiliensis]